MSLDTWVSNGWLVRHDASLQEIVDLLRAARRDLADAQQDISASWRFAIAYNAGLRLCTAALHAAGYRAAREQKHYRTVAALPLLLGAEAQELSDFLDRCRTQRHEVTYESLSAVTESEAEALIEAVGELDRKVCDWVRSKFPELPHDWPS